MIGFTEYSETNCHLVSLVYNTYEDLHDLYLKNRFEVRLFQTIPTKDNYNMKNIFVMGWIESSCCRTSPSMFFALWRVTKGGCAPRSFLKIRKYENHYPTVDVFCPMESHERGCAPRSFWLKPSLEFWTFFRPDIFFPLVISARFLCCWFYHKNSYHKWTVAGPLGCSISKIFGPDNFERLRI